jgi:hypothetical protein
LDEGIGDTLVSVDAMGGVGRSTLAFIRLRSYWAKEASPNRTGAVQAMYSIPGLAVSPFWFQEAGMIIPCNEGIAPNV